MDVKIMEKPRVLRLVKLETAGLSDPSGSSELSKWEGLQLNPVMTDHVIRQQLAGPRSVRGILGRFAGR